MTFDLEMIRGFYNNLKNKIDQTKAVVNRPLTLTEKNSLRPS